MHIMLLKLIWPFLEKYMARHAADYLRTHREQRLAPPAASDDEQAETTEEAAPRQGSVGQALAFTTLGVAIGSGLGFVVGQLIHQDK